MHTPMMDEDAIALEVDFLRGKFPKNMELIPSLLANPEHEMLRNNNSTSALLFSPEKYISPGKVETIAQRIEKNHVKMNDDNSNNLSDIQDKKSFENSFEETISKE